MKSSIKENIQILKKKVSGFKLGPIRKNTLANFMKDKFMDSAMKNGQMEDKSISVIGKKDYNMV